MLELRTLPDIQAALAAALQVWFDRTGDPTPHAVAAVRRRRQRLEVRLGSGGPWITPNNVWTTNAHRPQAALPLLPAPGLTVLCSAEATTAGHVLAMLIEQWGAQGQRIGLVDVRGALPNILGYASNQLGAYPETVWPLRDRLQLASMNGATLVAFGRMRWRALRPLVELINDGIPVVTTLPAPSLHRATTQLRQWWTLPHPPLRRRDGGHRRVASLAAPLRLVAVPAERAVGKVVCIDQHWKAT